MGMFNKVHRLDQIFPKIACFIFTGRNEVVAKVMFLQLCDSVHRGGVCQGDPPRRRPPNKETPQEGGTPQKEALLPEGGTPPIRRPSEGGTPQ